MRIEEKTYTTYSFVEMVLNQYSDETNAFYKTFNCAVGSAMAIGFLEVNSEFKGIKDLGDVVDLIAKFELFLQNFNCYQDIFDFFTQTDELQKVFEQTVVYIDKDIPNDIQWTIESDHRNIYVALMQVKKAFASCVNEAMDKIKRL